MRLIKFMLIVAIFSNIVNAKEVDCVANRVGADAAAREAASTNTALHAAAVGGGTLGACAVFLGLTGWFDFGLTAGICAITAAAAVAVTAPKSGGKAAEETYQEYIDPQCRQKK